MHHQLAHNTQTAQHITAITQEHTAYQTEVARKFVELEKKIVREISSEL